MQTSQLILREAEIEDVPVIHQMIVELARFEKLEHEVRCTPEILYQSLFPKLADVAAGTAIKSARALILELPVSSYSQSVPDLPYAYSTVYPDRLVVGFCLYFFNFSTFWGKHNVHLEDLYVREAFRGNGFGSVLLSSFVRHVLVHHQVNRVEWVVLNWNKGAIQVYERAGAIPMDEWTRYRLTDEALEKYASMDGLLTVIPSRKPTNQLDAVL